MAVRCPECGTINSGQNKYCSDCGHQIRPQTAGRCPECGAQNPVNNIFCDECGHRLVPTDPALGSQSSEGSVRGLSLPRREGTVEDGVPDWLARLRASFSEETGGEQEEAPDAPSAKMDATSLSSLDSESEDPPSWLDDLAGLDETELAQEDEKAPSGRGEGEDQLPDWLRQALAKPTLPADEEEQGAEEISESDDTEEPEIDWFDESTVQDEPEYEPAPAQAADQAEEPVSDGEDSELELPGKEFGVQPVTPELQPSGVVEDMEPEALAGWLESLSDEPLAEDLAGSEDQPDELPDWLQSVAVKDDESETDHRTDLQNTGLPDWLQALDLQDLESDAADELPGWLQDVTIEETPDETELGQPEPLLPEEPKTAAPERPGRPKRRLPTTGPLVPDELKEWLGETIGDEKEESAVSGPATKGTGKLGGTGPLVPPELPDWLAAVEDAPSTGELPGWLLQEDKEIVEEEEAPDLEPVDRPKTAPLPSWLKDDLGSAATEDEGEAVPGEIPDWLQPPPDMIDTGLERAELPSWLTPPEDSGIAAPDVDLAAEMPLWPGEQQEAGLDEEGLGLAEAIIPDWLQALKPQEAAETDIGLPSSELEKVETEGPLTGVRGALPIEGAIITTPETRPLPKFVVTEQQHDHVSVLKQIIHGGPEPKPEPAPVRTPQWWLERGLIPILVLAAVFIPALLRYLEQPIAIPHNDQTRSEVLDLYAEVEALDSTDTVIVAFDYSPAAAGELDAVAEPLLRHIVDQGARILAVSTVPAGPQLAHRSLQRIVPKAEAEAEVESDAVDNYVYGQDFLILGYVPGGAVGLQAFATEPWELFSGPDYLRQAPVAQETEAATGLAEGLGGAELILLLTASRDDLIGWMEQVGRLPNMKDVPIVGGLSAGLDPWAQPYYRTAQDYEPDEEDKEQLSGLVAGVPAAVEYAQRLGLEETGSAALLRDSQVAGLAVVAVFVVIGLIWGSLAGLSPRSRRNG